MPRLWGLPLQEGARWADILVGRSSFLVLGIWNLKFVCILYLVPCILESSPQP